MAAPYDKIIVVDFDTEEEGEEEEEKKLSIKSNPIDEINLSITSRTLKIT